VVLERGADPDRLVRIVDVPVTLSGLSRHNTANALAATAAALGLGLSRPAVVQGLRTFTPDPVLNEGRLNTYTLPLEGGGRATVIVDLAHNEAGLEALLDVARGLAAPGARVHLALGGTGDRSDEAIQALGEIAGKQADHVVVAHKPKYLRGRTIAEVDQHLRTGLARAGIGEVESYGTEMEGLLAAVPTLADGDALAFMCHDSQAAMRAWLADHGGTVDDPLTIRRKVVAARGEHELESEIAQLWAMTDDAERIEAADRLVSQHPRDARLVFELAGAHDVAGDPARAIGLYQSALAAGLREPYRHRAQIQAASTLRNLGDHDGALRLLDDVDLTHPGNVAATAFRALVLADSGRSGDAVANLLDALVERAADEDAVAYRGSVKRYAAELRTGQPSHSA
jgi:cyanophycin synthetase